MRRSLPALLALLFSGLVVVVPTSANAASGGGLPIPLPTVPEGDLAGVNDWSCQTSAEHPLPVVLVHGTFGDRRHLLEPMSHS
ncbi:MAG: lipase, partial [Nocardioides sp.]|nr:lipase [Nocardioides sp.]